MIMFAKQNCIFDTHKHTYIELISLFVCDKVLEIEALLPCSVSC